MSPVAPTAGAGGAFAGPPIQPAAVAAEVGKIKKSRTDNGQSKREREGWFLVKVPTAALPWSKIHVCVLHQTK